MPLPRILISAILAALLLSACGGASPASTSSTPAEAGVAATVPPEPATTTDIAAGAEESGESDAGEATGADVLATVAPDIAAELDPTALALATDPTALAEMQATIMAEKPSEDGCDPQMQNVNADRSTLEASWTPEGQINLQGSLDIPADAALFVFVYSDGAPIYWANFPEIDPATNEWNYTTASPAADDLFMGDLAQQNPYEPGDKVCVGVSAISGDVDLSELTDPSAAQDALLVQLRLPVGGEAPAAIALPTANPAGGEGICNEEGYMPVENFADLAPLLEGALADARAGAQAWQADARLFRMEVGCALMGGVRWDFHWISDAAKETASNTPQQPEVTPDENRAAAFDQVSGSQTIDPTTVSVTLDKLGEALIGAGYAPTDLLDIISRITLAHAAPDNSTFQPPEGGAEGLYYQVSITSNVEDLGEQVYVDATTGQVYKPE